MCTTKTDVRKIMIKILEETSPIVLNDLKKEVIKKFPKAKREDSRCVGTIKTMVFLNLDEGGIEDTDMGVTYTASLETE